MNIGKFTIGCIFVLAFSCSQETTAQDPPARSHPSFRDMLKNTAKTAPPKNLLSSLSNQDVSDSAKADAIVAASTVSIITPEERSAILEITQSRGSGNSLRLAGMMCLAMCCEESSLEDGHDIYKELTVVVQRELSVVTQSESELDFRINTCKILILLNRGSSAMSLWVSTALSAQKSEKMFEFCLDALTDCVQPDGPVTWEEVVLWMRTLADHRAALPSTRESILSKLYYEDGFMEETHGVLQCQLHGFAESMLDPGITTFKGQENAILLLSPDLPVSPVALSVIREVSVNPDAPVDTKEVAKEYLLDRRKDATDE